MKKLFALVLALCLMLCMSAQAESAFVSREVEWPITTEDVTITVMGPKGSLHIEWADMDLWQWLTEETGLKFQFITPTSESFRDNLSLTMSSGDLPDLFMSAGFTADDVVNYGVQQHLLAAMDEYFDVAPHVAKAYADYPEIYASTIAEDGHIYVQNLINLPIWTATQNHLFLNTTWLERVNKEIPTTIDEYHDVLLAFKEMDANGNGDATDEVPLGGQKNLGALRTTILSAYGLVSNDFEIQRDTGDVVYSPITENYKAYLKTMHQWWEEKLIDIDMFSQDNTSFKARAAEDKYGSFAGLASFVIAPASMILDFDMLTPLTSELNDKPLQFYNGALSFGVAGIASTSKYIPECMKLLDWMYTKEGVLTMSYGPHNYGFVEETGAHYFILEDGTGGANDAWRAQKTIAPGTAIPVNMRASEDSYSAFYSDSVNNYNNSILYAQITEHALPFIHYAQPKVVWTNDEAEAISGMTDMRNYVESMEAKFITGDADIDAEWDNYVKAVKSYGYDEIYEAYCSAWGRYADAIAALDAE